WLTLGDHGRGHPELSPPAAATLLVLAVIDVQRRRRIERIADLQRVDVEGGDQPAFVLHDRADVSAAGAAHEIVGDAESEAIARDRAGRAAELDRRRRTVAHRARAMAAAEGAGAAAGPHLLGLLVAR